MSIQDILDALKMSKGAFYHYFDSKTALLEAITEKMTIDAEQIITPIADDPELNAIEKFHAYFETSSRWKMARKDFLLELLRVWYNDDNLVIREKLLRSSKDVMLPMITKMIRQGIAEGTFSTPFPDQISEVVWSMMLSLGDSLSTWILKSEGMVEDTAREKLIQQINLITRAYSDAMERILGSQQGSLQIVDLDILKQWLISAPESELER
jgi:AcrR family transcriptional regulator